MREMNLAEAKIGQLLVVSIPGPENYSYIGHLEDTPRRCYGNPALYKATLSQTHPNSEIRGFGATWDGIFEPWWQPGEAKSRLSISLETRVKVLNDDPNYPLHPIDELLDHTMIGDIVTLAGNFTTATGVVYRIGDGNIGLATRTQAEFSRYERHVNTRHFRNFRVYKDIL